MFDYLHYFCFSLYQDLFFIVCMYVFVDVVMLGWDFSWNCYVPFRIVVEKRLLEEVRKNDTLIIVGETGSGKTTRKFTFAD